MVRKLSLRIAAYSVPLALLALSMASAILPISEDFHPSNPYWNGLETFFNVINATALDAAVSRVLPERSVLFIIGPYHEFTEARLEAIVFYVADGGTLVLMDETGAINPILSRLGLGIRVNGCFMLDAVFYYRSWKMPKAFAVKGGGPALGVEALAMNLPSILNIEGSKAKALALSSSFSFLDMDGDGRPSFHEPSGPFVLAADASYGKGRVIVISDSSLFLNSIIGREDNLLLLKNLVGARAAFVDTGVWPTSPQLAYRNAVIGTYRILSTPEVRYSLVLVTVMAIYRLAHMERSLPKDEELERLAEGHPSWDRSLLEALKEARDKVGE